MVPEGERAKKRGRISPAPDAQESIARYMLALRVFLKNATVRFHARVAAALL